MPESTHDSGHITASEPVWDLKIRTKDIDIAGPIAEDMIHQQTISLYRQCIQCKQNIGRYDKVLLVTSIVVVIVNYCYSYYDFARMTAELSLLVYTLWTSIFRMV